MTNYIRHDGVEVPVIQGAGGSGGGKGSPTVTPNNLFSSDVLYLTTALGEGPVYRINPNGPQDIEIQDNNIDDLINMQGNGLENTDKFLTITSSGTVSQDPLPLFGSDVTSPQSFASPVILKYGNIDGIPQSNITKQETSAAAWDAIRFNFTIDELLVAKDDGDILANSIEYRITIYDYLGLTEIISKDYTVTGKTDVPFKFSNKLDIPKADRSDNGYTFSISKVNKDSDNSKNRATIKITGWDEIEYTVLSYPRTALIGYAIKAANEHSGGIPNLTSMVKGLLVKVPANYNQPILETSEIDWRQLETAASGQYSYASSGYRLQKPGTGTVLYDDNPQIYKGTWDGTFVYSWTQNPVWIVYDLLTNTTYGLGIPEENIDKYKFYQVAMYCDACSAVDGTFIGVDAVADGSYRYKPLGYRKNIKGVKDVLIGLPKGTKVKERRFILDLSIYDNERAIDVLNKITSTFRSILIYAGGKISLAVDMPSEYPVMLFTDANIKQGSIQVSGVKESDILTGIDVSYIEPTNHFKREVVRLDRAEANDGSDVSTTENISTLDLTGVTRRSQAMRLAQYQIASSKYIRRNISFITGTEALNLAPGDVISIATNSTGVSYGYGGKVYANSATGTSSNTNVYIEHFTVPSITPSVFTSNVNPIALRTVSLDNDKMELYILDNTTYELISDNVTNGYDRVVVKAKTKYNPISKSFTSLSSGFSGNSAPIIGDIWSIGEIENPSNYYTNKSGKLFKVTGITREADESEVTVTGVEYISNVYIDSDTFIDYEPTAYVGITSPMSPPPTPILSFTKQTRRRLDGSIAVDGFLQDKTEKRGYDQKFEIEYYKSSTTLVPVSNVTSQSPVTIVSDVTGLANGTSVQLVGKNGFSSDIGTIKLLCTSVTTPVPGSIYLQLENLSACTDDNFGMHVLSVNDGSIPTLKGVDQINIPVHEKTNTSSSLNFVGYASELTNISRDITYVNLATNTVVVDDTFTGSATLSSSLPSTPFYVQINQILANNYYTANTFYVKGTEQTFIVSNTLNATTSTITLPAKPRNGSFVRFYVDGVIKSSGQYTLNINSSSDMYANIVYTKSSTAESHYRVEIDDYTVPKFELGDIVEVVSGNTFIVTNSSYDTASTSYNSVLTQSRIYKIELDESPAFDLSGYAFINVTQDPTGKVGNLSSSSFTLDYNTTTYPGAIHLANNNIYNIEYNSTYERLYLTQDQLIKDLPVGTTSIKARNRNLLGRLSPFVSKSVKVEELPIQKVQNLLLRESLYREQLGGVAIRVTCEFDHIIGQEVTDYEISYKWTYIEDIGSEDAGYALTSFNMVKVPASGVAEDGKIRFTINNVNRGLANASEPNSIIVKVTPLNRTISGITATVEQVIVGKKAPPANISGFVGGQQNDMLTFYWNYARNGNELLDLDLKEVIIKRVPGVSAASEENFLLGTPVVSVSVPSQRKSIPIDSFGTYTYLAKTIDTSGNLSDTVVSTIVTSSKSVRSLNVYAINEDNPGETFTDIPNNNPDEYYFPSFSSSTGGLSYAGSTSVDNANGASSGWSFDVGSPTNLLAPASATYTTQIRDVGTQLTGHILLDIQDSQSVQLTYNDMHEEVFAGVSDTNTWANVLVDADLAGGQGIGYLLGFDNASITTGRYDANNATWMTGPANGNVWAIWNHGQFAGDTANANSYALIAGLINASAIALGASYYANGVASTSNTMANVTTIPSSYTLVNLKQYSDLDGSTYVGTYGAVTAQTFIRTSIDYPYHANGNVNSSVFGAENGGFVPYEVGAKTFRYFQIQRVVTNILPDEHDYTIEKFRYTVEKQQTVYSNTALYSGSPTTVDLSSGKFITTPQISYAIKNQIDAISNAAIVVTTAISPTSVSFKLIASNGTGEYNANSTANVMVTAVGV